MAQQANVLEKLFGSATRVRLLRLFLLNPSEVFDVPAAVARVRANAGAVRKELSMLQDIGYIKKTSFIIEVSVRGKKKPKKKKMVGFTLMRQFPYLNELAALLASHAPHARERLAAGFKGVGRAQLVVIAGKLLGYDTEHVDIFIVGDSLKKAKIDHLLKSVEAEMGKELVYAMMGTQEFKYRYGMHDRFVGTLLDSPHEILINKIGIFDPGA